MASAKLPAVPHHLSGLRHDAQEQPLSVLLRCPYFSGLELAVASGNLTAVAAVLAALPAGTQRAAAAAKAAARWLTTPAADVAVLQLLLEAGADPLPELLPRLLLRYERSVTVVQQQPFHAQPNRFRSGLAAVLHTWQQQCSRGSTADTGAAPAGTPAASVLSAEAHMHLLLAAVFCLDSHLACQLIAAANDATWRQHAANCRLLVAAAEHDLPAVLTDLLALRTADNNEQPFSVAGAPGGAAAAAAAAMAAGLGLGGGGGMAHEGCTPLMAAAERNSCAALQVLLAAGAVVDQIDEDGVSALHWAVIGGSYEAAQLLLLHGASPNQACAPQPDGLHLERPLLTAVRDGSCHLARLLLAHGASLAAPTERGCTPLSVAVAFEQVEAAALLLGLGAHAAQAVPPEINGGRYSDPSRPARQPGEQQQNQGGGSTSSISSFASLLGLASTRVPAASAQLLDLLLGAGAVPTLGGTAGTAGGGGGGTAAATGAMAQLPLVEAAAAGSVAGVGHLLRWAQTQPRRTCLLRLGWVQAAGAAARRCLASDGCHEALCLLLDAWQQYQQQCQQQQRGRQQGQAAIMLPAAACCSIVAALLEAHSQQQAQHVQADKEPDAGCELQAVLLAERLAELGIAADFSAHLAAQPHNRSVILAALPPAQRWSPATHPYFPPAFKAASRQLLLCTARQTCKAGASKVPAAAPANLAALPLDTLYHVLNLSAQPLSFWLSKH